LSGMGCFKAKDAVDFGGNAANGILKGVIRLLFHAYMVAIIAGTRRAVTEGAPAGSQDPVASIPGVGSNHDCPSATRSGLTVFTDTSSYAALGVAPARALHESSEAWPARACSERYRVVPLRSNAAPAASPSGTTTGW